jgi:hypothetical protein
MVYIRTRYAVAVYLVVFGSIIVAAYKAGMVHEKARVVTARAIGDGGTIAVGAIAGGTIDSTTVLDVKESAPHVVPGPARPGTWKEAT